MFWSWEVASIDIASIMGCQLWQEFEGGMGGVCRLLAQNGEEMCGDGGREQQRMKGRGAAGPGQQLTIGGVLNVVI